MKLRAALPQVVNSVWHPVLRPSPGMISAGGVTPVWILVDPDFILVEILVSLLALMWDIPIATLINLSEKHKPVKCLRQKRAEVLRGA